MKRRSLTIAAVLLAAALLPNPAEGQTEGDEPRAGALNVYLDCEGARWACQTSHFRTEITFVNWVRDLADSQLHIIMTMEGTGSGDVFTMDFMGRDDLEGNDDQLSYSHSDTDSDDMRTQGITGLLAIGIARYSVLLGQTGPFVVNTPESGERRVELPPGLQGDVDDPWDYWVFRLGGEVEYEDEDLKDERQFSANLSANRTTEMWKLSLSGRGSYTKATGQYSDGTPYEDVREEGSIDGRVFYSLSERWSWGMEAGAATSTRNNQDLSGDIGTGVEYSFFPYRDWTRRRMTLQGLVYARYFDYEEETQFNKMSETVMEGALRWGIGFRQPWGTANLNASAEAYLHDPKKFHRLSFGGRLSIRIARGLEWNVGGSISRIKDQIYIPLADLSDEDILLGRRQLPTDSSLRLNTGFSFTFGSIYNNVVNNRFGYGGGGSRGGGGRGGF
ncbi:MAG: DUF481 domain-containing protein [Gemmatimonadetes bacterium]|nr:DUF481 domain-containing protein [Gemmatimonadota bacterium]